MNRYRWTDERRRRVLQALELAAGWEDSLADGLAEHGEDGKYRKDTEASAEGFRAMRRELMMAWGYRATRPTGAQ